MLTRTQGEKFEDMSLVKIGNKGTSLSQNNQACRADSPSDKDSENMIYVGEIGTNFQGRAARKIS